MASGYELWKKEKEKREKQEAESGVSTPAKPIKYVNKHYTGESATRKESYQWEKDFLSELPVKQYGRSYNDKFKNWASEQGIEESQLPEFRRWLDSKEDKVKDNSSFMDSVIRNKNRRDMQRIDNVEQMRTRQAEEAKQQEEENKKQVANKALGERDGFLGFLDRTAGRASRKAQEALLGKGFVEDQDENYRQSSNKTAQQMVNTKAREAEGVTENVADFLGMFTGETAKYIPAYKGAGLLGKGVAKVAPKAIPNSKIAKEFARGATAGTLVGTDRAMKEDTYSDDYGFSDYLKTIGTEAVLAGGADAVIGAAVRYAKTALEGDAQKAFLEGMVNKLSNGKSPEEIDRMFRLTELEFGQTSKPKSRPSAPLGSPKVLGPTPPAQGPMPVSKNPSPFGTDDWLNFAQQGTPKSRPLGFLDPVEETLKQKPVGYYKDLYEQVANHNGSGLFDDTVTQLGQDSKAIQEAITNERNRFIQEYVAKNKNFDDVWGSYGNEQTTPDEMQRLMNEVDSIDKSTATQANENELAWNAVKELSKEKDRILGQYGKIAIPESNWADWGNEIPPMFRAKKGSNVNDIYSVADAEGMTPDELVTHLKQIADSSKTRKMDITKPIDEQKNRLDELLDQIRNPKTTMQADKTSQWTQEAENSFLESDFFQSQNEILKAIDQDMQTYTNPTKEMIYKQLKSEKDPDDFNQLVDLYIRDLDDFEKTRLRESLISDPKIKQGIQSLTVTPKTDNPLDAILATEQQIAPTAEARNPFSFNDPKIDDLLGYTPPKQAVTEVEKEAFEPLIRMNLQQHNLAESNPLINISDDVVSEKAITSLHDKYYENYVNRNHSAQVTEEKIIQNKLKQAQESGNADLVSEWKKELKRVKREGSSFEKALTNEQTADGVAKTFLEGHFKNLAKSLGKTKDTSRELAKAFEYQMARNLLYNKKRNPDYQLPKGWDWERVVGIENAGKGKYDNFTQEFGKLTQEWRDTMYKYDLIDREAYEALGENPFYIPMYRDKSWKLDNIDSGYKLGSNTNKRSVDPHVLYEMGEGDYDSFFKDPLEAIVDNTYRLHRAALKNDTGLQIKRLAELDDTKQLIKAISEEEYLKGGGIEVFTNGKKEYYRPQNDLLELMKENDAGLNNDVLGKMTSLMSSLKTRSLEFQMTSIPRELTESFVKSKANVYQWFIHAFKAVSNKQATVKETGAYFHNAWQDHIGGIDPNVMTKEFKKQMGEKVKVVDLKSKEGWKDFGKMFLKIADMPFKPSKALGQYFDNLPREIEALEATRRFNKKHGNTMESMQSSLYEMNQMIDEASKITDPFDPRLQGFDDIKASRDSLESSMRAMERELAREQTYQARDIMNYGRSGRGKVAQVARKYVMFANTTTQSKDKLIREFTKNPVNTLTKTAFVLAPLVYTAEKARQMATGEDAELYENLPSYITQFNFVYIKDGNMVLVPKVQELALLVNPIEDALAGRSLNESLRLGVKETVPYQMGNIAQAFVPDENGNVRMNNMSVPGTLFTPGAEIALNKKMFTKKPISYSQMYEKDPNKQTASNFTPEMLKQIAGDNPNADMLDYAARQYGGDLGKYGIAFLDYLFNQSDETQKRLIQDFNPLQDRYYSSRNENFKGIPQK